MTNGEVIGFNLSKKFNVILLIIYVYIYTYQKKEDFSYYLMENED